MSETLIHERLSRVFQNVFDDPTLAIHDAMTAANVEEWDSLSHINLITAVEKEFRVRFSTAEIMGLKDVGALKDLIRRKSGA